jgi:ribonuclease HI
VDDITWVVTGKTVEEVATKLQRRARETLDWAMRNGVQIESDKTEAILFSRGRKESAKAKRITMRVGDNQVKFNTEATRWLGVYLDSHLTFKRHKEIWTAKARAAQRRLHRLCGKDGVKPGAAAKIQVACVQSIALYGMEAWTIDGEARSTSQLTPFQRIINEQARRTTGMLPSTPEGALMASSGLTPASTLVGRRKGRFWARLQGAPLSQDRNNYPKPWFDMRKYTAQFLGNVPIETTKADVDHVDEILGTIVIKDADKAQHDAEYYAQLGDSTYFTDGSRQEGGQAGAACIRVVDKHANRVERILRPLGMGKEAFDAELIAILLALQDADSRMNKGILMGQVRIFSDSLSALQRIKTIGHGSGQRLVEQIHDWEKRILCEDVEIFYHWVPAHEGVWGNEIADKAAKEAAGIADRHVFPHHRYRSLANTARVISEGSTKARKRFISKRQGKKFEWNGRLRMNPTLKNENKKDASVFWQFACGHALTGEYLKCKIRKTEDDTCWHCESGQQMTRTHLFERCTAFKEERKQLWRDIGQARKDESVAKGRRRAKLITTGKLFAHEKYTKAVLGFLRATRIGRTGRPPDDEGQAGDESE